MMKWYTILLPLLAIGVAILVWYTYKYTREGFQTPPPPPTTQYSNSQVFLVQVTGKEETLTRTAGAAVCASIGARVATLDELKGATGYINLCDKWGWMSFGFPQKVDTETNTKYAVCGGGVKSAAPTITRAAVERLCGITYATGDDTLKVRDNTLLNVPSRLNYIPSNVKPQYREFMKCDSDDGVRCKTPGNGSVAGLLSSEGYSYYITAKDKKYADSACAQAARVNDNYKRVADVFCFGQRPPSSTSIPGLTIFPATGKAGVATTTNLQRPYFGGTAATALPSLTSTAFDASGGGTTTFTIFDMNAIQLQAKILKNDYAVLKANTIAAEQGHKDRTNIYDINRQRIRQGFELYRAIRNDEFGDFSSTNYEKYFTEHKAIINNDINNIIENIDSNPIPALLQLKRLENSELLKIYSLTPSQTNDGTCLPIMYNIPPTMDYINKRTNMDFGMRWTTSAGAASGQEAVKANPPVSIRNNTDIVYFMLQVNGVNIFNESGSRVCYFPIDVPGLASATFNDNEVNFASKCNTDYARNMGLHRCFDPNLLKNYSKYTCDRYGLPDGSPLLLKWLLSRNSWVQYSVDWFKYVFPNDNILYYAIDKVDNVCPPTLVQFTRSDYRSDFLVNPNAWDFSSRLSADNAALIAAFKAAKGNVAANFLWRGVLVRGAVTELNRQEVRRSVSLSIYFSLQNATNIEQQIRVDSTDPTKLYMSPTSSAMPEVQGKMTQTQPVQFVISVDNEAKTNNDIMCSVQLTQDDLFYIPYHARQFIVKWADTRADRLKKFQESQVTARTGAEQATLIATNVVQTTFTAGLRKPLFDMASVSTAGATGPKTYLTRAEKQELLNRMAQLYYDLGDGTKIMDTILDVYQIGDTIYDVRFKQKVKGNTNIRNTISSLTATYNSLRSKRLTAADLLALEADYQQRLSDYYTQEEQNTSGNANCSPVRARYVSIKAANTGKRIRLSQVVVVGEDGSNLTQGIASFTYFSTLNCILSDTAYPTELYKEPVYMFDGSQLSGSAATDQLLRLNDTSRQKKLSLLIDGTTTPRPPPAIYDGLYSSFTNMSTYTATRQPTGTANVNDDFLLLDLGTENFINAVKLVLPDDNNPTAMNADTSYVVSLLNYYKQPVQGATTTIPNAVSNPIAKFVTGDATCPSDLTNPYRTARFYASTGQSATTDRSLANIRFCGYTEDANMSDLTLLSTFTFNPLYNGGFTLDITAQSGNQNFKPSISFTKNFTQAQAALNCANADKLKEILREFTLSLGQANFLSRDDIQRLPQPGQPAYRPEFYDYYVSSIQQSAQVSPDTCAIQWYEQQYERTTYNTEIPVLRTGIFKMTPDTENWYSPRIIYNVSQSRLYSSVTEYNTANSGKSLAPVAGGPIKVDMPLPADRTLDDGNGACDPRRCSDLDVIGSIIADFNSVQGSSQKILRVNKAVTANSRRCDFEVVMADYSPGAAVSSVVTTISTMVSVDTSSAPACKYTLAKGTMPTLAVSTGKFVTESTPYLTKIYTYVSDFLEPIYSVLKANMDEIIGLAGAQDTATGQNIRTTLTTYRKDTLAAYGALKPLKNGMCQTSDVTNRCYDPAILNSFINYHSNTFWRTRRLKTILRAATASDSECDFTFDAADMSYNATARALMEGTGTTRAMRCRMAPDPDRCGFSLSTATYAMEETFSYTPPGGPVISTQTELVCQGLGARVARTIDLDAAYRAGANWTTPGWVADMPYAYAPVAGFGVSTTQLPPPTIDMPDPTFAVNCFGVKPPQGTAGVLPFNAAANRYNMPTATITGPCIEILPSEPTMDDLTNVGYKPNTALTTASAAAYSTTTTMSSRPYSVRTTATSPLDYIDCQSNYAKNTLYNGTTITKIAQLSLSSCAVNGTGIVTFKKEAGKTILVLDRRLPINSSYAPSMDVTTSVTQAPTLNLTTAIANDTDCMRTGLVNLINIQGLQSGKRIDANTCEYRVTDRNDLPFGATFKRIGFYNENTTTIAIKEFSDATPSNSLWVYQPPLRTNLAAKFAELAGSFRTFFNAKYYDGITATEANPQQRVGRLTSAGYINAEDAVIFRGEYVKIGPLGDADIREFASDKEFKVIFRNGPNNTNLIYFASVLPQTAGVQMTPYGDTNYQTDPLVKSTAALLANQTKFRMVRLTNTATSDCEIYRINFFKNVDATNGVVDRRDGATNLDQYIVNLSRASVTLTDPNLQGAELLDPTYLADGPLPCTDPSYTPFNKGQGQYYTKGVDPVTRFSTCTLDISRLPDTPTPSTRALYTYPMSANRPCKIGYWPDVVAIIETKALLDKEVTKVPPPINATKYYVKGENRLYQYDAAAARFNALTDTPQCKLRYFFNDVLYTFTKSDTLNAYTPRLVLRPNQSLVIRFNDYIDINGYIVVGGAGSRTPSSWKLEGSINGLQWADIHSQSSPTFTSDANFKYTNPILRIPSSAASKSYQIDANRSSETITPITTTEGFQTYQPAWQPLRMAEQAPLQFMPSFRQTRAAIPVAPVAPVTTRIREETRMTWFRFRVLETRDPMSKYVSMSDFRFYTATGTPADMRGIKVSNFGGTRRSPKEGPEALFLPNGRWVDYSKSPLLFRFETREAPFIGYRFSETTGDWAAAPAKWVLEGSYDGRAWTILHDSRRAPVGIQGTGSAVHRFLNQV